MAVQRQGNWQGQMRVDIPHLRQLESGVVYDFDVVGQMMTARVPTVVTGFTFSKTGAIGADAEKLVLNVASSMLLHYNATEAGSFFRVDDARAAEVLGPTNARVRGSFTPGTINYVGLDLIRQADDSTADDVQFLVPSTNVERARRTPIARSMDYRIVVSTTSFTSATGVCPIALVTTDASNRVTGIVDARWLMFRLGSGGSTPNAVNPFSWPGGRNESDAGTADIAGDRSIFSLKEWIAAAMTRIWEIGGGEFWYSLAADRNVRLVAADATKFSSTVEAFEWVSSNLHWQALEVVFDNSNGAVNTIAAQLSNSAGLTDLADGEVIYVDLDRTQTTALTVQKGVLQTLGGSTDRPGQRWVIAWRVGSQIFVRDQAEAVGLPHRAATATRRGEVIIAANPTDPTDIANPKVPVIVGGLELAVCGGISHATGSVTGSTLVGSNINIGQGVNEGDGNVTAMADRGFQVVLLGDQDDNAGEPAATKIRQSNTTNPLPTTNKTLELSAYDGATEKVAHQFDAGGAMGFRNLPDGFAPATPSPTFDVPIRSKIWFQTNGLASPFTRDIMYVMGWDGASTPIWQSNPY